MSYWPFGGRHPELERKLTRIAKHGERQVMTYQRKTILTGLHELVVESYTLPISASLNKGLSRGAFLALSDSDFLFATRSGELHHVVLDGKTAKAYLLGSLGVPEQASDVSGAGLTDLLLLAPGRLLASMLLHDADKDCYALGLFEFSFDTAKKAVDRTRQLFQSQPCLTKDNVPFEAGGRIVRFSDDSVLLSVGHFGPVTRLGDYGSVVRIRLSDGLSSVFATGLRNEQGLFFDEESGLIIETEHGPRGGDEINVLQEGKDYGWPDVTYGTSYTVSDDESVESRCWTNTRCGQHKQHQLPLFAFVPSIGIANLLRYPSDGPEFHRWRGNLLVASLRAETLFRLEYDEGRIIFSEPIPLGERLRDIALLPNGSIALRTDTATLLVLSRARAVAQK
jgi:glucose/arabinose dehydrogenase